MKKSILLAALLFAVTSAFPQESSETKEPEIHHNPWELIIYRPVNTDTLNDVRCFLKMEDAETGEDVTYTKVTAKYEWTALTKVFPKTHFDISNFYIPGRIYTLYEYEKSFYLNGGMAMHLNLKKGKYKITVTTPAKDHAFFNCSNKDDWYSNEYYYDTENPLKVIFVSPTANENGFYNGGWWISTKAPQVYKVTKPVRTPAPGKK